MEFVLNGRSVGREAVGATKRGIAHAELTYDPGTLEAIAYRDGAEVGRTSLTTAGDVAQMRLDADHAEVRHGPDALAYVTLTLLDSAGVQNPANDRAVTFSVEGPAVLQGVGSA